MPLTAGSRESGARFARGKKKKVITFFENDVFPSSYLVDSDAHKEANLWAQKPDIKAGNQRLANYHHQWYIIEKFDSLPFMYKIVEKLSINEYKRLSKTMEAVNGRQIEERLGEFYRRNDLLNRKTTQNGGEGSNFNVEIFEHSQQNKQIRRVGEDQDSKRQNKLDTDEDFVSGNENWQRNGSSGLESDPNARKSKDDTIYLSAVERGDIKPRTSHTSASAGRLFLSVLCCC